VIARLPRTTLAIGLATAFVATACRTPTPVVAPPPPRDLIVLTPHPEDGALGIVTVTTAAGSASLTQANEGVQVPLGAAPGAPAILPEAEVQRIFGEALAAMPPPARRYLLYFESGSDALTPAARALVGDILTTVRQRTRPDVSIIGHTDTTGVASANVRLGLRRAELVRDLLLGAGLAADLVELASHGETNPVVATADNTDEAKNRRVEVTVR